MFIYEHEQAQRQQLGVIHFRNRPLGLGFRVGIRIGRLGILVFDGKRALQLAILRAQPGEFRSLFGQHADLIAQFEQFELIFLQSRQLFSFPGGGGQRGVLFILQLGLLLLDCLKLLAHLRGLMGFVDSHRNRKASFVRMPEDSLMAV